MSEITNEMLDSYADTVKMYMQVGHSKDKAKKLAGQKFPWYQDISFDNPSDASRISHALRRRGVGKAMEVTTAHSDNGNGHKIGNAGELTRWLFKRWCKDRGEVKVGDVFEISPEFWLDLYEAMTGQRYKVPASFSNEFMPSQAKDSRLWDEGWEFEPMKGNSAKKSAFRVVKVPAPPQPVVEEKGPIQPPAVAKEFTRAEAESLAANAAAKALEDFVRNIQMANGRLPF